MKVNLRKAELEDCKTIEELQKLSFAPIIKKYQRAEICVGCQSFDEVRNKLNLRHHNYFIIEYGCVPVGLIHLENQDEASIQQLHTICVHPSYRGKGIAQKALDILENEVLPDTMPAGMLALDTIKEEKVALYLTEKLGFSPVSEEFIDDTLTKVHFVKPR